MHARHTMLAAVALALVAGGVSAQSMEGSLEMPAYGIRAGATFATLGGSDISNAKTRTSFVGGVYATWPVAGGFSLQPELLYSMQGTKGEGSSDGTAVSGTLQMDYIQIPLLGRYTFPMSGQTHPYVALGPSFGFQMKCDVSGTSGIATASMSCGDFNDQFGGLDRKRFDLSGVLEAGVDFRLQMMQLTVGGSYAHGFIDAFKDANVRNRVWSIFAGIGF